MKRSAVPDSSWDQGRFKNRGRHLCLECHMTSGQAQALLTPVPAPRFHSTRWNLLTPTSLRLALGVIFLVVFSLGCISYSVSESGVAEENNVDYRALGAAALSEADQLTDEFDRTTPLLWEDHPLARLAQESFANVCKVSEPSSAHIGGGFFDKHSAFEYFNDSKITLRVVPNDAPLALIYPNGRLYVTTGLIDPSLPSAARTPGS